MQPLDSFSSAESVIRQRVGVLFEVRNYFDEYTWIIARDPSLQRGTGLLEE